VLGGTNGFEKKKGAMGIFENPSAWKCTGGGANGANICLGAGGGEGVGKGLKLKKRWKGTEKRRFFGFGGEVVVAGARPWGGGGGGRAGISVSKQSGLPGPTQGQIFAPARRARGLPGGPSPPQFRGPITLKEWKGTFPAQKPGGGGGGDGGPSTAGNGFSPGRALFREIWDPARQAGGGPALGGDFTGSVGRWGVGGLLCPKKGGNGFPVFWGSFIFRFQAGDFAWAPLFTPRAGLCNRGKNAGPGWGYCVSPAILYWRPKGGQKPSGGPVKNPFAGMGRGEKKGPSEKKKKKKKRGRGGSQGSPPKKVQHGPRPRPPSLFRGLAHPMRG